MEEERDALLSKLPDYKKLPPTEDDIRVYFSCELPFEYPDGTSGVYSIIVLCLLDYGRVQALNATKDAISRWTPRYVLLVGIAGGIKENEVSLGDIIVSDLAVDYELQKITKTQEKHRFKAHNCDPRLIGAAQNFLGDEWLKLLTVTRPEEGKPRRLIGPIATGDKVVQRKSLINKLLKSWGKLIGLEMEAGGVASGCFQSVAPPGFFMVRGVSDLADENKETEEVKNWRPYACDVAASYAIALLKSGPIPVTSKLPENKSNINKLINELNNHTSGLLHPIHSDITFNDSVIKLDRSTVLSSLKSTLENSPILILSGEGGVGKTALVKDFYNSIEENTPIFIFKATEFDTTHVNNIFRNYGEFTLIDFVKKFEGVTEKYFVVDSAEKLSDFSNQEAFQELTSTLLQNKWKIIFTTRHSYVNDLKFQFVEIYRLQFELFNIDKIKPQELEELSNTHSFTLPRNERFLELLQNPFYLSEFLQNYNALENSENFAAFKNLLWNKQIINSSHHKDNLHIKREECFLKIAKRRVDTGKFFVDIDTCDNSALQALEEDEVIGKDSRTGGYFITHDIYEEWALDRLIERNFLKSDYYKSFFESLGSSLPIRRAFRIWLSNKLSDDRNNIKQLIENSFVNEEIDSFWKDEILVSVLLSDYSEAFFQMFENILLANDQEILIKIVFLLRIACKEIDENLLKLFGNKDEENPVLDSIFTKPKGKGWDCSIDFINRYKEQIGLSKIGMFLPLLGEWNSVYKQGITTKNASQTALFYYEEIYGNDFSYRYKDNKKQLIETILGGSAEIKSELKNIFDEVVAKKQKNHRSKYYELTRTILSSARSSYEISQNLPGEIIKLAELFWLYTPAEDEDEDEYRYSKMTEVEDYFCISTNSSEYFPASAFQTPIFQLLKFAPRATIDFILSFTNKTVECYANSELKYEVEKIKVLVDEENVEQYISHRLWNTYRGTQVSTSLLASIHMALEKFLLDFGKIATKENLESWCKYLIKNSKSSSITAIVASLVLAYPEKLFDIATILFRTKEFFLYDTARMLHDQSSKSLYSMGYGLNYKNKIYEDERIKTCDDAHRKFSLEHIALNYQFLKSKDNLDFDKQSEALWAIWDKYYSALPPESEQSENDKTWRLYLARMDTRKMSPTYEKEENGDRILVTFNPEIDAELKKHSEEALQMLSASMKYTPLQLWANSRFKKEKGSYEKYPQYENDLHLALSETKEVIKEIRENKESALPFNRPTPAFCCAVLLRDFYDELSSEEKEFCRDITTEFASLPLHNDDYENHIFDGAEPAIKSLALLIKHFPQNKDDVKLLLFLLLLNHSKKISIFAIESVFFDLWNSNYEDAQSIFLGFLQLKPKYDKLAENIIEEKYNNIFFSSYASSKELIPQFVQECEIELESVIQNKISFQDLGTLQDLNFRTLITAFELLPLGTTDESHKKFVTAISSIFANDEKMQTEDKNDGFTLKRRILNKFAFFVLSSTRDEVKSYIQPFIENFEITDNAADFFSAFVSAEDDLNQYENFWIVWDLFYEKIVEICRKSSSYHYTKPIVHNYLLAWQWWREDARTWRSLKDREKLFFRKVAQDIGHYAPVLYSLSKFLNQIGSEFLDDGIIWIGSILEKNGGIIIGEQKKAGEIFDNLMLR